MPFNLQFRVPRPGGFPRTLYMQKRRRPSALTYRPFTSTTTRPGILGLHRDPIDWGRSSPTLAELETQRKGRAAKAFALYPQPPGAYSKVCPEPLKAVHAQQIALLDPTGARTRLFDVDNPESAKVGDILLVRNKEGDPFAGVCLNIRRRGPDTGILLRGNLTRVGVEMWYKIYSPNIEGIEIVQRRAKRARRAKLYYMRLPKHDVGSVENVVQQYIRQRQSLRSGGGKKGRDADSHRRHGKKNKSK